ncbi:hypothetical protein MVEN_01708100 [Mycena venus]|uniref:Mid2 domain-containing protein n=1 Tax=Mycena venus TaxID=2733690 RepID=A0A8H6XNA1_9AGAR|nr:hypothetical protein MVEN_01708100 [Mycena venus]
MSDLDISTNGSILSPSLPTDGSTPASPSSSSITTPSTDRSTPASPSDASITHSSPSQTSTVPSSSSFDTSTTSSAIHSNSSQTATDTFSSTGKTTAGQLSSPSISVTSPTSASSSANTSIPLVAGARKSSNHTGTIAGIAIGITVLIISVLVGILFYIGRRRRRTPAVLVPAPYLESASSDGPSLPTTDPEKQAGGPHFTTIERRSSRAAERRQEYLNNRIRVAQRELDAMNDAVNTSSLDREGAGEPSLEEAKQQIQALKDEIRMLQRRLESQWALGVSDEPPPEYME